MPAAWRAWRCWEVFAVDWSLARASSSTVRGAWASRSSSSRRRGLANALPIRAIASKTASFSRREPIRCYSIDHLIACQAMYFRQLLNDETACASYVLGCKTHSTFVVVDPHVDLVDDADDRGLLRVGEVGRRRPGEAADDAGCDLFVGFPGQLAHGGSDERR